MIRWTILLVLLVYQVVVTPAIRDTGMGYDGVQYLKYAENMLELHEFTFDGINPSSGRAPGYPVFLAAFLYLFDSFDLVFPVQLFFLFAAYYIVARTFKDHYPPGWDLGVVALLVFCWPLNSLGLGLLSESLFIFLITCGLFFLARFLNGSRITDLLFFAACATLSAYVRPVSLLFIPFVGLILLFFHKLRWRQAIIMIGLSAVMLAPWTYRNWINFGKFIPLASNYGSIFYMTDQEAFEAIMIGSATASHALPVYEEIVGDDFELDLAANERYLARAKTNIARDPWGFIRRCSLKTIFVWSQLPHTRHLFTKNPLLFYPGVLVQLTFLAVSVFGAYRFRRTHPWLVWPPFLFALYNLFILFPFHAESRFLLPVYINFCGFAFYTLCLVTQRVGKIFRQRRSDNRNPVA